MDCHFWESVIKCSNFVLFTHILFTSIICASMQPCISLSIYHLFIDYLSSSPIFFLLFPFSFSFFSINYNFKWHSELPFGDIRKAKWKYNKGRSKRIMYSEGKHPAWSNGKLFWMWFLLTSSFVRKCEASITVRFLCILSLDLLFVVWFWFALVWSSRYKNLFKLKRVFSERSQWHTHC